MLGANLLKAFGLNALITEVMHSTGWCTDHKQHI